MPAWEEIFGAGSTAEQILLWSIGSAFAQAVLGPILTAIGSDLWSKAVEGSGGVLHSPLSAADYADMVVRGIMGKGDAAAGATLTGVNGGDFTALVENAGEPPGLEQVLEAWRRGYIGWDDTGVETPSAERAVKTGRIYDYWAPVIKQLAEVPLSPGEAVNALLRGQVPADWATAEAGFSGVNAERFKVLLDSAGRPPSPSELTELYRRGFIPLSGVGPGETSFQQGIFEGDAKDKWWQLYARLAEYHPPPRTVTTLLRTGSIDAATAQRLWQEAGLSPELAAAYAHSASGEKLAGTRQLAEQQIVTLYETQAIDAAVATTHLEALGYDAAEAAYVLELTDLTRELRAVNSAIARVGTLYVAHKITRQAAESTLASLDLAGGHIEAVLAVWDTERTAVVHPLTAAQIVDAWEYANMDQAEATAELVNIGYTPFDAWILLSNKAKGPLPNRPAKGAGGPGTNP